MEQHERYQSMRYTTNKIRDQREKDNAIVQRWHEELGPDRIRLTEDEEQELWERKLLRL